MLQNVEVRPLKAKALFTHPSFTQALSFNALACSPRQWLARVSGGVASVPGGVGLSTFAIKQGFVRAQDDLGLEVFFEQALLLCAPRALYKLLRIDDVSNFERGVYSSLRDVRHAIERQPRTRVVSFEYYFDCFEQLGVNDFYLLDAYEPGDFNWYAESTLLETVKGPDVRCYLKRLSEISSCRLMGEAGLSAENIALLEYVAQHYMHAVLLSAYMRCLGDFVTLGMPYSFSAHDDSIYMVRP